MCSWDSSRRSTSCELLCRAHRLQISNPATSFTTTAVGWGGSWPCRAPTQRSSPAKPSGFCLSESFLERRDAHTSQSRMRQRLGRTPPSEALTTSAFMPGKHSAHYSKRIVVRLEPDTAHPDTMAAQISKIHTPPNPAPSARAARVARFVNEYGH